MTSEEEKRSNGVSSENTLRHSNRTPKTEEKRGNGVSSKLVQPQSRREKRRVVQARQLIILCLKCVNSHVVTPLMHKQTNKLKLHRNWEREQQDTPVWPKRSYNHALKGL